MRLWRQRAARCLLFWMAFGLLVPFAAATRTRIDAAAHTTASTRVPHCAPHGSDDAPAAPARATECQWVMALSCCAQPAAAGTDAPSAPPAASLLAFLPAPPAPAHGSVRRPDRPSLPPPLSPRSAVVLLQI